MTLFKSLRVRLSFPLVVLYGLLLFLVALLLLCLVGIFRSPLVIFGFDINFNAVSAFVAVVALFFAILLGFDFFSEKINKPKISYKIYGPDKDNGHQYWHMYLANKSSTVLRNAALYLVAFKSSTQEKMQNIPFYRFHWPYEVGDPHNDKRRPIVEFQQVGLFSSEEGGKFHFGRVPTKVKPPAYKQAIVIAVQLMGENYHGERQWVRIERTEEDFSSSRQWTVTLLAKNKPEHKELEKEYENLFEKPEKPSN